MTQLFYDNESQYSCDTTTAFNESGSTRHLCKHLRNKLQVNQYKMIAVLKNYILEEEIVEL